MLDWLQAFQIYAAVWIIIFIGLLCGGLKIFTPKDVYSIRRLVYLVPMAAMLFREIGNSKLKKDTWMSFLQAVLVQGVLHIISLVYAFIYHPDESVSMKFLKNAMSLCQTDFLYYAVPISQILFTPSIAAHAALACFLQYLCIVPLHEILALTFIPDCEKKMNTKHEPQDPVPPLEPKEVPNADQEEEEEMADVSSTGEVEVIDENGNPHIVKVQEDELEEDHHEDQSQSYSKPNKANNSDNQNKESNTTTDTPKEEEPQETKQEPPPPDVPTDKPAQKPAKYWSKNWLIFWAFVNQFTICGILGIIWSAIGISMPKFLEGLVTDLEKAIFAAGLFCNGVVIWNHSFKNAPVLDVIVAVLCHFFVEPALSWGFSALIGQDKDVTKFLILSNAAPVAMYAYHLSLTFELGESMISYSLYWTSVLTLPVYLIWTAIINFAPYFK